MLCCKTLCAMSLLFNNSLRSGLLKYGHWNSVTEPVEGLEVLQKIPVIFSLFHSFAFLTHRYCFYCYKQLTTNPSLQTRGRSVNLNGDAKKLERIPCKYILQYSTAFRQAQGPGFIWPVKSSNFNLSHHSYLLTHYSSRITSHSSLPSFHTTHPTILNLPSTIWRRMHRWNDSIQYVFDSHRWRGFHLPLV